MDVHPKPNGIPWPPLLLMAAIGSAYLMGLDLPFTVRGNLLSSILGFLTTAVGVVFDAWAIITMRRSGTNILPNRAAGRLVTDGPFRFSRNPIYLGNAFLCAGLALVTANSWFVVTAALMIAAVDRLAVRRGDRHLEQRFGEAWVRYRDSTPRWLI